MAGRSLAAAAAGWGVLLLASCSGDDSGAPAGLGSTGEDLYLQSCALCHGTDLRGTDRGPSHLSAVYAPDHHPDDAFRAAVTQGSPAHHWDFGDMAPVPGLSDEEIDLIISYVRDQQEAQGLEPYPPG